MPTTLPADVPLGDLLEQRRLTHRDRRLAHILGVLRSRADVAQPVSPSLLQAISDFSCERATVARRLRELAGDPVDD